VNWGTPVRTGVMPSARGVQVVELDLIKRPQPRYLKLEVIDTWAQANAPVYFHQLRIDEMWVGTGHPSAAPAAPTGYEAETGTVRGFARVTPCEICSGGSKVANIGNDIGNDVTLTVNPARGGDYLLTLVGMVAGTRSFSVSVNGGPTIAVPMTGSSFLSPLVARSIQVHLRSAANTIRIFNDTAYAPDLDRITVSSLSG
jgi:hypothetical protein